MKYLFFLILIPMLLKAQDPSTFDTVKVNKFITPTKYDHFLYGHETEVKWQKLPDYDRYKLSLSPDGNRWWLTSDSIVGNTYQWEVSDMNCDSCQWKVEPYMDEDTRFLKHEWTRTPKPDTLGFEPHDLINTSDSNMLVFGWHDIYSKNTERDQSDFYVAKYTTEAELIWEYEYGDLDSNDRANAARETENGDFIVVGTTESTNQGVVPFGKKDIVAIKLDKDGNKIWRRTYGGKDNDWGMKILPAQDGGFYIGGQTGSSDRYFKKNEGQVDYFIMKIDSEGYMEWSQTYGREKDELLDDMQFDPDGNIILFGFSNSRDSVYMSDKYATWRDKSHSWVLKIDEDGKKLWDFQYGIGIEEYGDMTVQSDGSIVAHMMSTDWTRDSGWGNDYHVYMAIKISSSGELLYDREYLEAYIWGYYKQFINSRGNITDLSGGYILEIDSSSKIIWSRRLDESIYNKRSIIETKDHSLVVVGKNKPGELIFQKYTVSPLAVPEYSDFFSVETSKPTFTKDTIWFPLKSTFTDIDTLLTDIICNKGSITGKLEDYKFGILSDSRTSIKEMIHEDDYLEPDECADLSIRNEVHGDGQKVETIYFINPYNNNQISENTLTLITNVIDRAIITDYDIIHFGNVEIGDTSEVKYISLINLTHIDISVAVYGYQENYSAKREPTVVQADSIVLLPFLFNPLDSGYLRYTYDLKYELYGGNIEKSIEIKVRGTGIPKKETSVSETSEHTQTTYPNPATNTVNLSGYAEGSVYIYDITGKQVRIAAVESGRVDISDLMAGVYFLKDSNGEVVGKFVKE